MGGFLGEFFLFRSKKYKPRLNDVPIFLFVVFGIFFISNLHNPDIEILRNFGNPKQQYYHKKTFKETQVLAVFTISRI